MFFILSKALLFLLAPFNWFIVCVAGGLFLKHEKWKMIFRRAALIIYLFFTNSVIFLEFCRLLETPGKRIESVGHYDVGIVLTGMAEYNNDLRVLSIRRGADRIWQAISLYKKGKIDKILITGDTGYVTDRGLHEAKQMKEVLVSWGIPAHDILSEEQSKNTYENAVESAKLLKRKLPKAKHLLLITSATHMRRAMACFKHAGLKCTSFSTDHYTGPKRSYFWDQYIIPNWGNFGCWEQLTKESFGYVVYKLTNKA